MVAVFVPIVDGSKVTVNVIEFPGAIVPEVVPVIVKSAVAPVTDVIIKSKVPKFSIVKVLGLLPEAISIFPKSVSSVVIG
ncbi:MAG: hypothetical protein COB73_01160 [Flavobacteriaceae bacterium]|nr:MAG: hypothetical protein COB73_01160 [Flavobacteriaceae bacterium]